MPLLFFNKPTPAVEKLKGKPMPAHTVNPWSKLVLSWPARVFKVARSRQLTDDGGSSRSSRGR